jgi:flagellar biosynthesis activator protein FlaF
MPLDIATLEKAQTAERSSAAAAGAYETHAKQGAVSQRELEARVLLKTTARLEALRTGWDTAGREEMADALSYNRKAWLIFYDNALEGERAEPGAGDAAGALRRNIITLARFVFGRELAILADPAPEKLDILISINRNVAAGLMGDGGAQGGVSA